jgi:site-specific recombinase XerD
VGNCTSRTLGFYRDNLQRFAHFPGATLHCDQLLIQRYLTHLRDHMQPVTAHAHFRTLKVFFGWCVETRLLRETPMHGITMKLPKTLPRVPEDLAVRRLLDACSPLGFVGRRNRALIGLLADSGLRISEALRLRIEEVNFSTRTLAVRGGKGQKDGTGFFGAETAALLRSWLQIRQDANPEDYLFTEMQGRPLSRSTACHILHRLSVRAGLPRKIGPHALRHYAATSILRQTGDLELVRQVLRHETLGMALKYAHIARPEISRKFRRASPLDNLRAGR